MTKKEIAKCVYDFVTCSEHSCVDCSANQFVKTVYTDERRICDVLNIIDCGTLVSKEDK